jgi:peptidoglycan/LPS O-acetylase OafA/YrhL
MVVAVGASALSLWSAWNPGYYYLARAAVFMFIGAVASYLVVKERGGRHGLTASLLYVTVLFSIAIAVELVTASPDPIETTSTWYTPLALLFLAAAAISAVATGSKGTSESREP